VFKNISQFEVPMKNFILDERFKGVENLNEVFDCFVFGDVLLLFEVDQQVALVAVLKDQVKVIGRFFEVVQFYDVAVVAGFQDFDLVLEQLVEFT
jgi:hypothetical protein